MSVSLSGIGVNLPNNNWIRQAHGSKSVSLGNIINAYNNAGGSGRLQEFAHDEEEIELEEKYGSDMILYFEGNYRKKMAQACSRFYSAVMDQDLSHDGDFNLFQHLINCVPKETPQGTLVTKINKSSARKIDLAIASIMAFDRWSDLIREDQEPEPNAPQFINL